MFRLAKEHAPHAQLVYNDYMSWGERLRQASRRGAQAPARNSASAGTPVNALGLQSHIGSTEDGNEPPTARYATCASGAASWTRSRRWTTTCSSPSSTCSDNALPTDIAQRDAAVATLGRTYLDVTL